MISPGDHHGNSQIPHKPVRSFGRRSAAIASDGRFGSPPTVGGTRPPRLVRPAWTIWITRASVSEIEKRNSLHQETLTKEAHSPA